MSDATPPDDHPTPALTTDAPAEQRPRRIGLLTAIVGVVLVLDVVTKIVVVAVMEPGVPHEFLPGLVYFTLIRNPGAAFGMADSMTWVLSIVVIAVLVLIIRLARRLRSTAWAISLGLILGGALGNFADRVFRSPGFLHGHVVDFISLFNPYGQGFAIFNVADMAITFGGITLVITALRGVEVDGTRVGGKKADEDAVNDGAASNGGDASNSEAADDPTTGVGTPGSADRAADGKEPGDD